MSDQSPGSYHDPHRIRTFYQEVESGGKGYYGLPYFGLARPLGTGRRRKCAVHMNNIPSITRVSHGGKGIYPARKLTRQTHNVRLPGQFLLSGPRRS